MGLKELPEQHEVWQWFYWNSGEYACAVVAVFNTEVHDWAAYIAGFNGQKEMECVEFAARNGEKLSRRTAYHFFPDLGPFEYRE